MSKLKTLSKETEYLLLVNILVPIEDFLISVTSWFIIRLNIK